MSPWPGVLIFGVVLLVVSIVATVLSACLVQGARTVGILSYNTHKFGCHYGLYLLFCSSGKSHKYKCFLLCEPFPYLYFALQRNVRLMKPWIVLTGISLVPGLGLVIFALIKLPMQFTLHCITMWVCTSYCLKMVWLYKAEVEADNGLRGYLDNWGKLHYKREDGEVVEAWGSFLDCTNHQNHPFLGSDWLKGIQLVWVKYLFRTLANQNLSYWNR